MIKIRELHAWIGITPAGHEHVMFVLLNGRSNNPFFLQTDLTDEAEAMRPVAEKILQASKATPDPLARIELRTFRWTP